MKEPSRGYSQANWLGWIASIPMLILLALPSKATANDPGGCFMVTSDGRTVSLGGLCGAAPTSNGIILIPIKRRVGRTPVVDVTFNGKKTYEMIFDTGASSTLITLSMASDLKMKATGVLNAQIADGSQVQFMTGKVNTLAAGSAMMSNVEVAIAPRADMGLLGHDFFGNYDVKIREKVVELHPR